MSGGLLGDVLPWCLSKGNQARRKLSGLLDDPMGQAEQTLGLLADSTHKQNALMAAAFGDRKQPFKVTDTNALEQAVGGVMNGAMGFAPAGVLIGAGSSAANHIALKAAQDMEQRGIKPETIWLQTGWGKAPDGRWRYEIDDRRAIPREESPPSGPMQEAEARLVKAREALSQKERAAQFPFAPEYFQQATGVPLDKLRR